MRNSCCPGRTNQPPRAVFLVGFMGAGKTTVGRALADHLAWRFVDLDQYIEEREGGTIVEIFQQVGEAEFRRAESAALKQLLAEIKSGAPLVAALGGGTFVQPENVAGLQKAVVVFLDAPLDELLERCRRPSMHVRPLFREAAEFRKLYEARRPHYLRARLHVQTAGKTIEAIVAEIASALGLDAPPRLK